MPPRFWPISNRPHFYPPHKADFVQPRLPFGWHFVFMFSLRGNPISKFQITFFVKGRHTTVSLSSFELQKRRKILLPKIVSPVPNKSYRIEPSFAFGR